MASVETKTVIEQFPPRSDEERAALLDWIATVPLTYGAWKYFKGLYKHVEKLSLSPEYSSDIAEVLTALLARLDTAPLAGSSTNAAALPGTQNLGQIQGLSVQGNLAYVSIGEQWYNRNRQLLVFDVTDPLRPLRLGSTKINGIGQVIMHGHYACVPSIDNYDPLARLFLVDVSDPAQPNQLKAVEIGQARDIDFRGSYAYITAQVGRAEKDAALEIWKFEPLEQVAKVGSVAINDARNVAVAGDYAFVVTGSTGFSWSSLPRAGGLRVVDIRNPQKPVVAASLDLGDVQGIIVSGEYAFVSIRAGQKTRFQVVNISDPVNPRKLGSLDVEGQISDIKVHRGHIFLAAGYSGLQVIDFSDPAKLRAVTKIENIPAVQTIAASGDYVLLACGWAGSMVVDISDPTKPARVGQPPSARTMGYMKRRVRRLLRTLAKSEDERFVELAAGVLQRAGHGKKELDFKNQWVSADLLLGNSQRYQQQRHGRGAYALKTPRFNFKTREERAPQAWDKRPDLALKLYENSDLPPQTHEAVLKILRAAGTPLPKLGKKRLTQFLSSSSPLLMTTATAQVAAAIETGTQVEAGVAARAYGLSGARNRRTIEARLNGYDETWRRDFGKKLFALATTQLRDGRMSRRQQSAALLLSREFTNFVAPSQVREAAALLLASGRAELSQWALAAIREVPVNAVLPLIDALANLPEDARESARMALLQAVEGHNFDLPTVRGLVNSFNNWRCETGWQLLEASATEPDTLNQLWRELLSAERETTPLQIALSSPAAFAVLDRSGFEASEIAELLRDRPWLLRLLSPEVFARIAPILPPALVVHLISSATDEIWSAVREVWLQTMPGEKVAPFWQAAWKSLETDASLVARLLHDREATNTFRAIDVASFAAFLQTDNPQVGSLLGDWLSLHQHQIEKGDPLLLTAATHELAEVRDWGLKQVRAQGLTLPLALRLLEAELPACVAVGREFFDVAKVGGDEEFDYALALCDSPRQSVRAMGREFIQSRRESLPHELLRRRLYENSNPDMQAFVAELLLEQPEPAPEFDAGVLRSRNRARRAKELVKKRVEQHPSTPDVATLLEMARSRTPRDAEWAQAQLARLALEGQQIEGFVVDGVAGI